jgi:nucleoside-diphosphate-sugar epimerase
VVSHVNTLLVIGFGYLGRAILARSAQASSGLMVVGVSRTPGSAALAADVTRLDSLRFVKAAYAEPAGIVYAVSPGARDPIAYKNAYEIGLRNTLDLWENTRLALISSTAVYGRASGKLDDYSEVLPESDTEKVIFSGEQEVLSRSSQNVVIRASGIYGPGRTSLLRRLLQEDLSSLESERTTSRIHVEDLAQIALSRLLHPDRSGVYLASDPEPATLGTMFGFVRLHPRATEIGRELSQLAPRATSRSRTGPERSLFPRRLIDEGYKFRFPSFRQGYSAIMDAWPREPHELLK